MAAFSVHPETAAVRMVSLSPQILPAVDRDGLTRLDYKMSISAFPNPASVNNELSPATSNHGFTHEGFFVLEDPTFPEPFPIEFVLDVPEFTDVNTNGIHDFYDPNAPIENVQTEGFHENGSGGATRFTAIWNRAAGQNSGMVRIDLPFLGRRFNHQFSLLQFDGVFDFTRESTNRNGTVTLTNVAAATEIISGPFMASVAKTNVLTYSGSSWKDQSDFIYRFLALDILELAKADFVTVLSFEDDGFPATSDPDYFDWLFTLRADDLGGNGIADIVEDTTTPVVQPRLLAEKAPEGIRITILAPVGTSCIVQTATDVSSSNWATERTLTLTAAQESFTLAVPDAKRFFRLMVN